jgi:hypothetical protein
MLSQTTWAKISKRAEHTIDAYNIISIEELQNADHEYFKLSEPIFL